VCTWVEEIKMSEKKIACLDKEEGTSDVAIGTQSTPAADGYFHLRHAITTLRQPPSGGLHKANVDRSGVAFDGVALGIRRRGKRCHIVAFA
jgi:hypothetical protein